VWKFWPLLMILCYGVLDAVSTLWIFGLRGDMIAYMLFMLFSLPGIADLVIKGPGNGRIGKIRGKSS
jgi:hypothetical protein